jgi:hypothetical protein
MSAEWRFDQALLAGQPYRTISNDFGPSKTALMRHKTLHLRVCVNTPEVQVLQYAGQNASKELGKCWGPPCIFEPRARF